MLFESESFGGTVQRDDESCQENTHKRRILCYERFNVYEVGRWGTQEKYCQKGAHMVELAGNPSFPAEGFI
jgi:hypothetical protein